MADKTEDAKQNKQDTTKNTKKSATGEKKTLLELVRASEKHYTLILLYLSKNNLINQYYDELDLEKERRTIKPTITEAEFNKIIGD